MAAQRRLRPDQGNRAVHHEHKAQSLERAEWLRQQLEAVNEVAQAIGVGAALLMILQLIVDRARQLTEAQYAVLAIGTDPARPFSPYAVSGLSQEQVAAIGQPPRPVGVRGLVAREGKVICTSDVRRHPSFAGFPPEHPEIISFLGMPVRAQGQSIGSLYLANKRAAAEFTKDDESMIGLLAAHAGIAVQQGRLLEAVQTERARLETILESDAHGVIVVDAATRRQRLNRRASQILGLAAGREATLSEYGGRVLRPDGQALPMAGWPASRSLQGETVSDEEMLIERPDGTRIPVLASAAPIRDASGAITAAVVVLHDLTERQRAEEELRKSEESLARAQRIARLGNWDWDITANKVRWSDEIYRIFGLTPQAFGATYEAFLLSVHPDDREMIKTAISQALSEGQPYRIDHRIVRPDGSERIVHEEAEVVRDATGRPVRMIGTVQDVTEQRQAEADRERLLEQLDAERSWLQAVIQTSPVGVLLFEGPTGERLIANQWAERLFGFSFKPEAGVNQMLGFACRPSGIPLPFEELASSRALRGQIITGEEQVLCRPDGRHVPVLVSAGPIRDATGGIIGAVVVFEDITPLKELERLREEWTSVIAHDLRQPITTIKGYASLLARLAHRWPMSAPQQTAVEHILSSACQLERMIGDLLDVSRLEARRLKLERQPVKMASLVRDTVERMAEATRGHPVRIEIGDGIPTIEADPVRLEQVLGNLLSNAAKYSYPETEILVTVETRDGEILVGVTNRGPGISPEDLPRLGTRFFRARLVQEGHAAGLGLGLYITKGLVEAHGGRLWAESVPGQTTTFYFALPVVPPAD